MSEIDFWVMIERELRLAREREAAAREDARLAIEDKAATIAELARLKGLLLQLEEAREREAAARIAAEQAVLEGVEAKAELERLKEGRK